MKYYGNLMDLISRFGLPLNVHSINTPKDYWWRVEYITSDGTPVGTRYYSDSQKGEFCHSDKDDIGDHLNDIYWVKEYWDHLHRFEKPQCDHAEVKLIGNIYLCTNCDYRLEPLGWIKHED